MFSFTRAALTALLVNLLNSRLWVRQLQSTGMLTSMSEARVHSDVFLLGRLELPCL
jgi:hypothetical protein